MHLGGNFRWHHTIPEQLEDSFLIFLTLGLTKQSNTNTTIYAETFTEANAQKINCKPKSGRIHMPVGLGLAGIELPAIENIAIGAMTADEAG